MKRIQLRNLKSKKSNISRKDIEEAMKNYKGTIKNLNVRKKPSISNEDDEMDDFCV